MNRIILDLETAPLPEIPDPPDSILNKGIGSHWKDEGKIEGKRQENREAWIAESPLEPLNSQVIAVGIMPVDGEHPFICMADSTYETELISHAWAAIREADDIVGYNVLDFDIGTVLFQRSVILGVQPSRRLSLARYKTAPIIDLMQLWSNWGKRRYWPLSYLTERLGLPTKPHGDGEDVAGWYAEGNWSEIEKHLTADLHMTRELYHVMRGVYF